MNTYGWRKNHPVAFVVGLINSMNRNQTIRGNREHVLSHAANGVFCLEISGMEYLTKAPSPRRTSWEQVTRCLNSRPSGLAKDPLVSSSLA